ncbi:hypothetical protein Taro_046728 [Colocasia esculenta]|uniref:Protein kinase domain-containing protein n=1 Tax=Colocasia esculenta TaxID=4460 RepID=A0A843WT80_COLES|nr:hypothetical protein [Colocasia esculenta]
MRTSRRCGLVPPDDIIILAQDADTKESSNEEDDDYVLVKQEDIVDAISCFMAAYLLSLKETKVHAQMINENVKSGKGQLAEQESIELAEKEKERWIGGYGPVFKASLDHTAVAIKILRPDAAQGARQFQQELIRKLFSA